MKKLISSLFIVLCSLFVFSTPAMAKVVMQEKGTVTIPAGETVDDDLFIGSENIDFAGVVTGSMFAGAGMADIKGNIKGDLILGTGKANLGGVIGGDLYLGAGDVVLTKVTVGGNIVVGAGNVMIDKDSKIGGSLIAGAGSVRNAAPIGRSAMIGAGTLYLDNKIGKEARLGGGNIELGPLTSIAGNMTYALEQDRGVLKQDPSATIAGTVTRYTPPVDARKDMAKAKADMAKFGRVAHGGWLMVSFLGSLLVGFLLLKLFPKTSLGLSTTASKSLMTSLGAGFLIVVAAVPLFLVLALTVIGLPLVGLLIPLFCIELHVAKLVSAYALGSFVTKQFSWHKMGVYAVFSIGLILFYLLRAVPGIGWITSVLFTWTGLGAIWLYTRANLKTL
jgi:hypothetical protein